MVQHPQNSVNYLVFIDGFGKFNSPKVVVNRGKETTEGTDYRREH